MIKLKATVNKTEIIRDSEIYCKDIFIDTYKANISEYGFMLGVKYILKELQIKNKQNKRYKCLVCGRDTFINKVSHKCVGGYRKHHLKWEEIN